MQNRTLVMEQVYLDQIIKLIYCQMDLDCKKHLGLVILVELHSFIVHGQKHQHLTCMVDSPTQDNINK